MNKPVLQIELVSDVSCPWCFLGYKRLEQAMTLVGEQIDFEVSWHPFELNLDLHLGGVELSAYFAKRYGATPEQYQAQLANMHQLGQEVGIEFNFDESTKIYNTRNAHKLLCWAAETGKQTLLKMALFNAYFCHGKAVDQTDTLLECVREVGLDEASAKRVIESEEWNKTVHDNEVQWLSLGVHAVPALVINQQHLINGAQPVDVLADALKDIAFNPDP
ncbi:DsbA family oxidoreductase [Vibrio tapetis]|uniref:Putative dithiol-disulfide isomerase involved in polyketide biosynthesis FrnE family n=1 Tax=Vibrio tapetis subsp. tapetis TaxID=1671868 RepID=A0A2N8ZC60_9VIBR|nr:DsbA family oxidoreductase [Vibrio tapetis]SON49496.1 putative dithiol-disulfide isomerase involved in polyketide biosynthesis FrnE family [Vibrio tapetis subsp. tapetis]